VVRTRLHHPPRSLAGWRLSEGIPAAAKCEVAPWGSGYRLEEPPFQPASPDGAVYFSPTHLQGLATLESGLTGDLSGLTPLTGEAGIGKTTLIYSLLQRDYKRVRIAHIDDAKLSFLEMLQVILKQLNLYSPGSTKLDYLSALDHLLELHGKEERIAIVIDESQVLSDDVLAELRLLSNHGQRDGRFCCSSFWWANPNSLSG
jgi:type II secretory pathway predicted ATPase ExeA